EQGREVFLCPPGSRLSSTTRRCATARRVRPSLSRPRTRSASRASSTAWASTMSRAASRGRTRRTRSCSPASRQSRSATRGWPPSARRAGASWVVLCDTNGGSQPDAIEEGVKAVRTALAGIGSKTRVGIHTHNDCELAVANSLAGVIAGAEMVQGTINGYGERCGNANLVSVVSNLVLKLGLDALPQASVEQFSELSRTVAEIANLALPLQQPFVGQ